MSYHTPSSVLIKFRKLGWQWQSLVLLAVLHNVKFSLPSTHAARQVLDAIQSLSTTNRNAMKTMLRREEKIMSNRSMSNNRNAVRKRRNGNTRTLSTSNRTRTTTVPRRKRPDNMAGGVPLSGPLPKWYYGHLV